LHNESQEFNLNPSTLNQLYPGLKDELSLKFSTAELERVGFDTPLNDHDKALRIQDPELFLYHILVKRMGRNKNSKVIETDAKAILNKVMAVNDVKYTRNKTSGILQT
jgi:hypothetical protein